MKLTHNTPSSSNLMLSSPFASSSSLRQMLPDVLFPLAGLGLCSIFSLQFLALRWRDLSKCREPATKTTVYKTVVLVAGSHVESDPRSTSAVRPRMSLNSHFYLSVYSFPPINVPQRIGNTLYVLCCGVKGQRPLHECCWVGWSFVLLGRGCQKNTKYVLQHHPFVHRLFDHLMLHIKLFTIWHLPHVWIIDSNREHDVHFLHIPDLIRHFSPVVIVSDGHNNTSELPTTPFRQSATFILQAYRCSPSLGTECFDPADHERCPPASVVLTVVYMLVHQNHFKFITMNPQRGRGAQSEQLGIWWQSL